MGLLELLGFGKTKKKILEFVERDAVIIDVRTPQEYKMGHINASKNIQLEKINKNLDKIQKLDKPIILYCRSGMRSGEAMRRLKAHGITEVVNGGAFIDLNNILRKVKNN